MADGPPGGVGGSGAAGGEGRDRSFPLVVGCGLLGAATACVGSARPWARARVEVPAVREVSVAGADVAAVTLPLALVVLASWGAFLVLRRRARRGVALLGAAASVGVLAATLGAAGDAEAAAADAAAAGAVAVSTSGTAWPWATAVGATLALVAFAVAVVRAARWPEMGSRYDRDPTAAAPSRAPGARQRADAAGAVHEPDWWRALDDGRDPTLDAPAPEPTPEPTRRRGAGTPEAGERGTTP